jgi:hypothetical protein
MTTTTPANSLSLGNIHSCKLPIPTHDLRVGSERNSVTVSFQNPGVATFCSQHDFSPLHLFQAVWALVLRSYCGEDSISFGSLLTNGFPNSTSKADPQTSENDTFRHREISVCCIRITRADLLPKVIRHIGDAQTSHFCQGDRTCPFNTVLIYSHHEPPDGSQSEIERRLDLHGLDEVSDRHSPCLPSAA